MTKADKKQTTADNRTVLSKDGIPLARVRRSPNAVAFLVTGFILGALVGLLIDIFGGQGGNYQAQSVTGYMLVFFGFLGTLLGGVVYLIVDKKYSN